MARNVNTTRGPWGVSSTSGAGIRGVIVNVYRCLDGCRFKDGRFRILYGQLNGLTVKDSDAASALCLEYGYLQRYSRNSCGFVMSRAARRRGYKTTDYRYCSVRKNYQA